MGKSFLYEQQATCYADYVTIKNDIDRYKKTEERGSDHGVHNAKPISNSTKKEGEK